MSTLATSPVPNNLTAPAPSSAEPCAEGAGQAATAYRRPLSLGIGAVAAVAVAGVGTLSHFTGQVVDNHRATWGTLDSPAFTVRSVSMQEPYVPYATQLLNERSRQTREVERYSELSATAAALQQELISLRASENDPERLALRTEGIAEKARQIAAELVVPRGELRPLGEIDAELLVRHGDAATFAREMFQKVTGRALPGITRIEASDDLPEGRDGLDGHGGEAREWASTVLYRPSSTSVDAATMLHEFGHLICLAGESQDSTFPVLRMSRSAEAHMREEAAAFLFVIAAREHVTDPMMRDALPGIDSFRIEQYLNGEDTAFHHNQAMAVADAALEHFGNPSAAYQHVASAEALDPAIEAIIERNRSLFLSGEGIDETRAVTLQSRAEARRSVAALESALGSVDGALAHRGN